MTTATLANEPQLTSSWTPEHLYFITFHTENRLINGLFGAVVPFQDVVHSETNVEAHYLGAITQEMHKIIVESINNPNCLAFWNADNTLKVRRISITFGANTYLDNSRNAIVGINNTVRLIPACVDQDGNVWNDITNIDVKNMEKKNFEISINGQDPSNYKATCTNNQEISFNLVDQGRATIQFKIMLPEISGLWLSVYPELFSYEAPDLAKFTAWASTQ